MPNALENISCRSVLEKRCASPQMALQKYVWLHCTNCEVLLGPHTQETVQDLNFKLGIQTKLQL